MVSNPGIQPGAIFHGMQVIVSPFLEPKPKLKLSANYRGTEVFRVAFDAWLVDMFAICESEYEVMDEFALTFDTPFQCAEAIRALIEGDGK